MWVHEIPVGDQRTRSVSIGVGVPVVRNSVSSLYGVHVYVTGYSYTSRLWYEVYSSRRHSFRAPVSVPSPGRGPSDGRTGGGRSEGGERRRRNKRVTVGSDDECGRVGEWGERPSP